MTDVAHSGRDENRRLLAADPDLLRQLESIGRQKTRPVFVDLSMLTPSPTELPDEIRKNLGAGLLLG